MTIRLLESAKEDLIAGFKFYEQQEKGLGNYFLDTLYSDINSLLIYAGIHPIKFEKYHCMYSSRFPFAVYYTIKNQTISVYAVLDCRQDPVRISERFNDD